MVNETAGKSIEEIEEMLGKKLEAWSSKHISSPHLERSRSLAASVRKWKAVRGILPFNGSLIRDKGNEGQETIWPYHQ